MEQSLVFNIQQSILQSQIIDFPFPHLIIKEFLPKCFLDELLEDLDTLEKTSTPDNIFDSKNGKKIEYKQKREEFLKFNNLLDIFGQELISKAIEQKFNLIKGSLFADPEFDGGGYVISPPGSYLRYHSDFNFSNKVQKYRKVNLILYMNENYKSEYGGELHLLNSHTMTVEQIHKPTLNSAVIFLTHKQTPHGVNINKLGFHRRSFNVYFYSNEPHDENDREPHKTIWYC